MATGSIAPEGYLPRVVDEQVERYLSIFGANRDRGDQVVRQDVVARSATGRA